MPYHSPQWDSRWQALYRAAIFGQNLSSAERLIAEAEAAIAIREKELAQSSGPWAFFTVVPTTLCAGFQYRSEAER